MKRLPDFFVVALCLTIGGLYLWQQRQQALIDRLETAIQLQNERLADVNYSLILSNMEEVREEMLNQGKNDNVGMIDTLNYLKSFRNSMLEQEQLPYEEASRLMQWMKEVYNANLPTDYPMSPMTAPISAELKRRTKLEIRREVLEREHDLLTLLQGRLGGAKCWGPKITISSMPVADYVRAGDTARIWVQVPLQAHLGQYEFAEIESDQGIMARIPGKQHALLKIPTEGILERGQREGWLEYNGKVRVPRATGGIETIPFSGKIKILRYHPISLPLVLESLPGC